VSHTPKNENLFSNDLKDVEVNDDVDSIIDVLAGIQIRSGIKTPVVLEEPEEDREATPVMPDISSLQKPSEIEDLLAQLKNTDLNDSDPDIQFNPRPSSDLDHNEPEQFGEEKSEEAQAPSAYEVIEPISAVKPMLVERVNSLKKEAKDQDQALLGTPVDVERIQPLCWPPTPPSKNGDASNNTERDPQVEVIKKTLFDSPIVVKPLENRSEAILQLEAKLFQPVIEELAKKSSPIKPKDDGRTATPEFEAVEKQLEKECSPVGAEDARTGTPEFEAVEKLLAMEAEQQSAETDVAKNEDDDLQVASNLDFLDDPNFNPFATKAKVVNDIDVLPVTMEKQFETVQEPTVPETVDNVEITESSHSEVAQDVSAKNDLPLPGNLDFLDDPNFNPFATKAKVVNDGEELPSDTIDAHFEPVLEPKMPETVDKMAEPKITEILAVDKALEVQHQNAEPEKVIIDPPPIVEEETVQDVEITESSHSEVAQDVAAKNDDVNLPLPGNLDFLDDPNFNPFDTKAKVVNDGEELPSDTVEAHFEPVHEPKVPETVDKMAEPKITEIAAVDKALEVQHQNADPEKVIVDPPPIVKEETVQEPLVEEPIVDDENITDPAKLSFLDKLDDPNFDPFATKAKVVNDGEELPVLSKASFLDRLDDPNFDPFATKSKVVNDGKELQPPPVSAEIILTPKPEKIKVKSVTESPLTKPTAIVKPCSDPVKQQTDNNSFEEVSNKSVKMEAQIENIIDVDAELQQNSDDKPKKKPLPAKPWLKKRKKAPVVVNEESEAKPAYNLDFLDKLDDPNFDPFATKTKVVNEAFQEEAELPTKQQNGGYNLDFLDKMDDPNFNPFESKVNVSNNDGALSGKSSPSLPALELCEEKKSTISSEQTKTVVVKDSTPEFEMAEKQLDSEEFTKHHSMIEEKQQQQQPPSNNDISDAFDTKIDQRLALEIDQEDDSLTTEPAFLFSAFNQSIPNNSPSTTLSSSINMETSTLKAVVPDPILPQPMLAKKVQSSASSLVGHCDLVEVRLSTK
jgi:hypothetical protein